MNKADLKKLIEKYGRDEKTLLRENPSLENLYAFSNQREGIVEWFPFEKGKKALVLGADEGALCGIFFRKGIALDVFENDSDEAEKLGVRFAKEKAEGKLKVIRNVNSFTAYDYIFAIGNINRIDIRVLSAAYEKLSAGGKLFVACDNRYGIKYLVGNRISDCAYERNELIGVLDSFSEGRDYFYYPMQDYMLPVSIYSEKYLPKRGELLHVIPAYADNEFTTIDLGKKYEEIVGDGRFEEFANSFLVVRTKGDEDSERVVFVKYNRTRKDEYKIKTLIYEDASGNRKAVKEALYESGKEHIESFAKKFDILSGEGRDISYAKPQISEDGLSVSFEYFEGDTLADKVIKAVELGHDVYEELRDVIAKVTGAEDVHNIDSILGNYIVGSRSLGGKAKLTGIDYEWVSKETQDKKYITWRILCEFYDSNLSLPGIEGISKEDFLRRFEITNDDIKIYNETEHDFQENIHGDNQAVYLDNYRVKVKTAEELSELNRNFDRLLEEKQGLLAQIKDKDSEIKKMTEVKRLTDNHVTNLEIMIRDLRNEIGRMGETLTYLNSHEALWSKAKRKAGEAYHKSYPKGSEQEKKLKYTKMSLLHPGEYRKFTKTEEGRNLMEGDFKIGEAYLENGKLDFEGGNFPLVSIVIPCYNQIEYTYNCLVSIKEYTTDVDYEIIIADDLSTDATSELEKFVTGVTIVRPEKNQGFLLNCNGAAAKARGKYILFLNNDTTVTEGWLSSLVDLMHRDKTVGMCGSKLVFPDGKLQEAGGIIWSDGSGWNYGRNDDPEDHQYNYVRDVDYISGAAILIRTELWKKIGGFDTRYVPAYCEDSDLAFEVRKAGYRVVYQPLSKVVHYEGVSNGTDVNASEGHKKYQVDNQKKLKEKWAAEFAKQYENTGNPDPFRARERSRGKEIILVIDHYVPTFDKDAGSRTTYQYLKMFIAKGYEVKFLPANYMHEEPYTTALEQMGIEVLYGERMQIDIWDWIDKHAKDLKLVYFNRPHIASRYIDYIREHTSLKCIYYGHDLHFLREEREYKLSGDVKTLESSHYWKSVELSIMRKADMSYYPSNVEIDAIKAIDKDIKAKAITAYVYDKFYERTKEDFAEREGILFVGGFAHPPNKDGLMWFAKEIWPKVHEATGAVFTVVGSNADEEVRSLDGDNGIVVKGFVTDEELMELYSTARVVAVPLRYGAGVKGKVVEALYYGCPIVTTSVGAEGIADAESVMRIEDDAEKFAEDLIFMYKASKTLKDMSDAALEYVKKHNSIDAAWEIIEGDFR